MAKFGTRVTFSCLQGYEYLDGNTTKHVQCHNGQWNYVLDNCKGNKHEPNTAIT